MSSTASTGAHRLLITTVSSPLGASVVATLASPELRTTRRSAAVDRPGPGTWTYRVGAGANWVDDPEMGDVFLLSNPVTVTVP